MQHKRGHARVLINACTVHEILSVEVQIKRIDVGQNSAENVGIVAGSHVGKSNVHAVGGANHVKNFILTKKTNQNQNDKEKRPKKKL